MNLGIQQQLFITIGATSGLGLATAKALVEEQARIIVVGRNKEALLTLQQQYPEQVEIVEGDITEEATQQQLYALIAERTIHGMLINAGGPPAKTFLETTLEDWDTAYQQILRWKVAVTKQFIPLFIKNGYGRIVYIESASVKQPMENLVLSNSLRVAVTGFVKTLSQEIAKSGVTLNILAPGPHDTPAIKRVYQKKSEQTGIAFDEVKLQGIKQIPVGTLGQANDFAALATWLLSPASKFITGQTIAVDGGTVKGIFG
ncbi:MAG: SDR family oxidoreductase [Bacteroidota bacterium]|nr:SDR family oxidoreductase [Bacteroidota bacterium]